MSADEAMSSEGLVRRVAMLWENEGWLARSRPTHSEVEAALSFCPQLGPVVVDYFVRTGGMSDGAWDT